MGKVISHQTSSCEVVFEGGKYIPGGGDAQPPLSPPGGGEVRESGTTYQSTNLPIYQPTNLPISQWTD
jgi:hypothetical protein